jgi:hypothetical protein
VRISDGLRNGRSELRIEFVTDLAQLEALAGPWETLNARLADHDAPFFQSFAWSIHVARVRSSRSADRYRVCVAKVLRGARLVGLWPLSLQRHGRAWLARSLDDPFGQFAGTVFHDRDDIVKASSPSWRRCAARGWRTACRSRVSSPGRRCTRG